MMSDGGFSGGSFFEVGLSGLVVIDRCYANQLDLGVVLPEAAPGRWSARIHEAEDGVRRALEARHERFEGEARWEVVAEDLCCDTPIVGIWDVSTFLGDHASIAKGPLADAVTVGGVQFLHCYDAWRCEVSVHRDGGRVVGVRAEWFGLGWSPAQWELPGGQVLFLEERRLCVFEPDGRFTEHSLAELHADGLDVLGELSIPEPIREHLTALFRRHGVGRALCG